MSWGIGRKSQFRQQFSVGVMTVYKVISHLV
jgi:hypothetical protein